MDSILAVVLCGGAGTRLYPLTEWRSKPAVPLLGKYRLVDIPISNCLNAGLDRIFVLTQFNSAGLNQHITDTYQMDGFGKGFVSVLSAEQTHYSPDWFKGTADAIRQVLHHMNRHQYSHVLVLAGDQLYQMDFADLYKKHLAQQADISVATTPVTAAEATGFGIMHTDAQDEIIRFHEKPDAEELVRLESDVDEEMQRQNRNYLASTGIYLFNREVLEQMLISDPEATDFGKEIIPNALEDHKVISYPFRGYWSDVGSISSYHAANIALSRTSSTINFYDPACPIHTKKETLPPPKIHSSYIQDAYIAEGSVLDSCKIYSSVLGVRSNVGKRTTIKNTVILGAEYYQGSAPEKWGSVELPANPGVGEACYIENAIIDLNVSIGNGVVLANRDGIQEGEGPNYYIKDGIIVIPQNASLPDGTVIGTSTRIDLSNVMRTEMAPPSMPVSLSI